MKMFSIPYLIQILFSETIENNFYEKLEVDNKLESLYKELQRRGDKITYLEKQIKELEIENQNLSNKLHQHIMDILG